MAVNKKNPPSTPSFDTRLYIGKVSHRRLRPVSHRFVYQVFSLLINLDELSTLDKTSRWFGHNRFSLFSLMDKDHGPKDGSPLRPWIEQKLQEGGHDFTLGRVRLLCFPRILGFVFNPLSVWYCYDTSEKLCAILYEVRNTFGEWGGYLLPVDPKSSPTALIRQSCDKAFYVSPLMEMNCRYHFALNDPGEKLSVAIRETQEGARTLLATQTGTALAFTDRILLKTFASHPLMFFKIITAIHWEALRTMIKGAKFQTNPKGVSGTVLHPDRKPEPPHASSGRPAP